MTHGQDDFTDQAEAERHHRLATQAFGLRFDPALPVAAERNVLSLTSAETCFAQRLDCRTYFVQALAHRNGQRPAACSVPDKEQLGIARAMLRQSGIPDAEIATEHVLREFGQAAEIDPETRRVVTLAPVSELGNSVHMTRQVEGVAIWSSHLRLKLTAKKEIDYLELHWPIVPEAVLREARRLAFMVANGWRAPAAAAAEIESVEAGIVHTPAVGYFFDMHAAIRVVHRSLEPTIGRKPTYHLDRHGEPVLLRRTAELIREPMRGPRAEARAGAQKERGPGSARPRTQ